MDGSPVVDVHTSSASMDLFGDIVVILKYWDAHGANCSYRSYQRFDMQTMQRALY